jgi:hypothetical protein
VRRIAGAAFILGALGIGVAVSVGAVPSARPATLLVPVLSAFSTGTFVLTFPWHRYDPVWFVLLWVPAIVLTVWGAALTGGLGSPVEPLLFVIVAAAAAYRGGLLLVLQIAGTALAPLVVHALAPDPAFTRPRLMAHVGIEAGALAVVGLLARAGAGGRR